MYKLDTLGFAGGAVHDPVGALMLCASAQVDALVINGTVKIKDGRLLGINLPKLIARHNQLAMQLANA